MYNHQLFRAFFCCLLVAVLAFSCTRKAETYLYLSDGDQLNFPEASLDLKKTGVCFSGGGTRAMTCAAGQMKALYDLDMWQHFGYISSVSGGSWASSIFTYYEVREEGPQNDKELLGTPLGAENLTMDYLKEPVPKQWLLSPVTTDLSRRLLHNLATDDLTLGFEESPHDIWIDAIGAVYLQPFGLYGDRARRYFSFDENSVNSIISRAPRLKLSKNDFHLVHNQVGDAPRPYLVMNSCIISPPVDFPIKAPAPLSVMNYSPLGVGSAKYNEATGQSGNLTDKFPVGGGFIEPYAMGGSSPIHAPEVIDKTLSLAEVRLSEHHRFRLADAVGTSSAAFAVTIAQSERDEIVTDLLALGSIIPREEYWSPGAEGTLAREYGFGDGGSLENFGVLSLLQRDVDRLVVFVNTDTPIDITHQEGDPVSNTEVIDYDFYSLFGNFTYGNHTRNHVFSKDDFYEIFGQFKKCIADGTTVMARTNTTTIPNKWWGIKAKEVEILWFYNESVPVWEEKLSEEIQREIDECSRGDFPDFPLYKTEFPEKLPFVVELSPAMAKLLYELQYYNVSINEKEFDFLRQ
ncbi:MAG: hypothetical protein ACRBG0_22640 [Lewinella sp.]|uniref:hypothetical protein n=1 Tax=Lewinella sp. TaxID=2004506 RepID=UPI003D6BFE25